MPLVVTASISDATVFANAGAEVVPLDEHFYYLDRAGFAERPARQDRSWCFMINASIMVANFKKYIDFGYYFLVDPIYGHLALLFFHRSVSNFVIQGGGWLSTVNPTDNDERVPTGAAFYRD